MPGPKPIEFNITQETVDELYGNILGRQGLFRAGVHPETGEAGFMVGRDWFRTPTEAFNHVQLRELTNYARFDSNVAMPAIGAGRYHRLENILDAIRKYRAANMGNPAEEEMLRKTEDLVIDRLAYTGTPKSVYHLYNELSKGGKSVGFDKPGFGDSPHIALRFYNKHGELGTNDITDLLERLGLDLTGAFDEEGAERVFSPKAIKRMNTWVDDSTFYMRRDTPFKVHTMRYKEGEGLEHLPESLRMAMEGMTLEDKEKMFDGISVVNPSILDNMADEMESRGEFLKLSDDVAEKAQGRKLVEQAEILRRHVAEGRPLEQIRALGLKEEGLEEIIGMVKGDPFGVTKEEWETLARALNIDPKMDMILGGKATKQMGIKVGGYLDADISVVLGHPNKHIFADIESMISYPELYHPGYMQQHTIDTLQGMLDQFLESRELSPDMIAYYEGVLLKQPKPGTNVISLLDQQARARMMLKKSALGVDPKQDHAYAVEYFRSLRKWIEPAAGKEFEPKLLAPGTLGAHIRPAWLAEASGKIDYHVARGQIGFDRKVGMMMHPEDISRAHALFGGFDLDDLLRGHTYLITDEAGNVMHDADDNPILKSIGIRNPLGMGETAAFDWAPGSYGEIVQQLATTNPELKSRARWLELNDIIIKRRDELSRSIAAAENPKITDQQLGHHLDNRERLEKLIDQLQEERNTLTATIRRDHPNWTIPDPLHALHPTLPEISVLDIPSHALPGHLSSIYGNLIAGRLHGESGILPSMSERNFQIFDTLGGYLGKSPQEVIKSPVYTDYDKWLADKGPGFEFTKYTADDFGVLDHEIADLGLDEIPKAFREMGIPMSQVKQLLGAYRNIDMVASSLRTQVEHKLDSTQGLVDATTGNFIKREVDTASPSGWKYIHHNAAGDILKTEDNFGFIPTVPTEDIIDMLTQGTPSKRIKTLEDAFDVASGMLHGMAEGASKYDLKFTRPGFERIMGPKRQNPWFKIFKQHLEDINPDKPFDYTTMLLNPDDPFEARFAHLEQLKEASNNVYSEVSGRMFRNYANQLHLPEAIEDASFSVEELFEASKLAATFDVANESLRESLKKREMFGESHFDKVFEMLEGSIQTISSAQVREATRHIPGFWEADSEGVERMTKKGVNIMNALRQQHERTHGTLTTRDELADQFLYAQIHAETRGGDMDYLDEQFITDKLTEKQYDQRREILENAPTRPEEIPDTRIKASREPLAKAAEERVAEGGVSGGVVRRRKAGEGAELAHEILGEGGIPLTNFREIDREEIVRLMKKPAVRNIGLGIAALVAGSTIYRHFRNRTPEDMQGPPLLPGGSAYEDSPARPMAPPLGGGNYPVQQGRGITYRVVTRGNHKESDLRSQAEAIAGAPSSGTIYNSPQIHGFGNNIRYAVAQTFGGYIQ